MTRQSKKDIELAILRGIYKRKRYPKYTVSERPDFIIHAKDDFGVEITEYYPDETGARMHNLPDYAKKITDKSYIHKDDVNELEVVHTEYFDEKARTWVKLDTPAVMQTYKSIQERITAVIQQVNAKSSLYSAYDKSIPCIDLIIHDARASFVDGMNEVYMRQAFKEVLQKGVFNSSDFRNIYLSIPGYDTRDLEVIKLK